MARSKVKSRSNHDIAHQCTPNQCPYQVLTSYTLWFPRYSTDKMFVGQGHYSNIEGQIKFESVLPCDSSDAL